MCKYQSFKHGGLIFGRFSIFAEDTVSRLEVEGVEYNVHYHIGAWHPVNSQYMSDK